MFVVVFFLFSKFLVQKTLKFQNDTFSECSQRREPSITCCGGDVGTGCAFHLHGEVIFWKIIKTPRGFGEMMLSAIL